MIESPGGDARREGRGPRSRFAGVQEREEEVVVTRNGRPAAVLLNIDEYERLKATIDVLSDPDLMRQIRTSQKYYARGRKGLSFEAVFGESLTPRKARGRR